MTSNGSDKEASERHARAARSVLSGRAGRSTPRRAAKPIRRVLLVVQNHALSSAVKGTLMKGNIWCAATTNITSARQMLRSILFSTVVVDLDQEGLNAAVLLREMSDRQPDVLRVAITASAGSDDAVLDFVDHVIAQPVDFDVLVQAILDR